MFTVVFENLKTRKTRLRENRPQTHPFKAEKVTLLKISRFLAIPAPKSLKIRQVLCVFCGFAIFEEKVRNLKYFLGNKPMPRPLFATLRFPVFGHCSKRYLFCFKSMPKMHFRPIAREEGSKKDQYSIGSSIGSGRARPEIAKARNTHKHCRILRLLGGRKSRKLENVEMCYLFCFKSMFQMRILRNLGNHDFRSNFEVAFGPAKHTTSCTFRVAGTVVGRKRKRSQP